EAVFPYLDKVGMVLVMTVEPGFGGQAFMADMMPKVAAIRKEIDRRSLKVMLQVDGGINEDTAVTAAKAGADVAVVGSALFNSPNPKELVKKIQDITF
ncbi:MAG TPA: ribulose-phosphate 3-epimerase, partial [Candidatus Avimonas sp.]|nr:ribulose-phosphate 3-epimerase [Candidatus Avimonas sp.]